MTITRATGELSIEEGKYIAYARKLDIQHGRLIFTGGPIQDPGRRSPRRQGISRMSPPASTCAARCCSRA